MLIRVRDSIATKEIKTLYYKQKPRSAHGRLHCDAFIMFVLDHDETAEARTPINYQFL